MALIDELKARREAAANKLEDAHLSAAHLRADVDDLDLAIAALEPLPAVEIEITGANQPDDYGPQPSAHLTHDIGVFGPFTADSHENDVCVPVPGTGEESRDHSDDASEFAEEGYAPVKQAEPLADPIWNEPEPTKPEADALAKAADYYSPEAVAERNKFNPFAMFRKEGDQ